MRLRGLNLKDLIVMDTPVPTLRGRKVLITGAGKRNRRGDGSRRRSRRRRRTRPHRSACRPSRRHSRHQSLRRLVVYRLAGDVLDWTAVRSFADHVDAEVGTMDVVMNIAGVSAWGTVENSEHRRWRKIVTFDLMGPVHVIECFVPQMVRRGHGGHLVKLASAAGLLALPWHAAYSASKFGIRGVSEVLRFDLRRRHSSASRWYAQAGWTPLVDTVEIVGIEPVRSAREISDRPLPQGRGQPGDRCIRRFSREFRKNRLPGLHLAF